MKTTTKKLTLCAVMAALSVALLYIGSLSVLDMTAVIVCALITMLIFIEAGPKYAWLTAAVTGVLALLLLPVKLLAVEYLFVGGIYPILKAYFEKFPAFPSWMFKISALDTMLLVLIALSRLAFFAPEDAFFDFSWIVILCGTVFFILYDLALTACVTAYITKIRKRLGLKKLF